jgi:acyl carrier protein
VREAVVVARADDSGDKRLVAYLLAESGAQLAPAQLRAALSTQLAEYMLPSAYVTLEAFPLTPNGKLDRQALPAPDGTAVVSRAYAAPAGDVEVALVGIVEELLGIKHIGRDDHFFALGGHSLLAIQLALKLETQFEINLPLREIFQNPTIAAMGDVITTLLLERYASDDVQTIDSEIEGLSEQELLEILSGNRKV